MSLITVDGRSALVTRDAEAEQLGDAAITTKLLGDADTTDGAVSANRAIMRPDAAGPPPHYHKTAAEIFFVLDGAVEALAGDRLVTIERGDFLVVPKGMPHTFAPAPGQAADVLVLFAPGLNERFEYFRLANRVMRGEASPQEIFGSQERFDNYFVQSPVWTRGQYTAAG
jgi:mannose-6-phosphate isomerase-like protein (cupin superfamily)